MKLDDARARLIAWLNEQVKTTSSDEERRFWEDTLRPVEVTQSKRRQEALKVQLEVYAHITVWSAYPDVAVYVCTHHEGKLYHAIGWATKGPRDKWNEGRGFEIATSRALDKIVERIVCQQEQCK